VAYVHLQIAKAEIQHAMGPGIQEAFAAVRTQGAEVAGPWFTVHHKITAEGWDFDICVPIKNSIQPVGRVNCKQLTSVPAATCSYFGNYDGLGAAWPALRAWVDAQNLQRKSWICEVYLTGPESGLPPSQWQTQLYQPLES
jgi:effector-binding domain-containing protein